MLVLVLVLVLVLMLVAAFSAWCLLWLLARSPKGNPPPSKAVVGGGWVSATSFGAGHSAASAAQRWPAKAQQLLLAGRPFYCSQRLFEGWPGGGDQSLVGACRAPSWQSPGCACGHYRVPLRAFSLSLAFEHFALAMIPS